MSYYRNLVKGQWQIGDLVFGHGTNILVNSTEVAAADVNGQDYQMARSDSKNFGFDQLVPTTIQFDLSVLHNYLLPGNEEMIPNFWHSMPTIEDLAHEWGADDVRNKWGEMKPIYHRSRLDDIPKVIYGRPGSFQYRMDDEYNRGEVMNVVAEFRRGDTLAYGIQEKRATITAEEPEITINGHSGKAPTPMRILLVGPIEHPIVTLTNLWNQSESVVVELDYDVDEGEVVEISGYPWSRRVVSSTGEALPRYLVGDSPYLDKLYFNFNAVVHIDVVASYTDENTRVHVLFRDAYRVI
ncbi:minor tail protein [Mycobacterium phage Labelle]|nr:minor tail protein [Mycobacterium phage Labelle]